MEQSPTPDSNTNWCCILSTFVVAGGLCFFGVSLALRGDGRTGLVLLLSSGGLLALSICAAIGKFRPQGEDKTSPSMPDDPEDRPPSYRLSWRRSFMRRVRHRNDEDEEEGASGGGGGGRRWWQGRGKRGKGDEGRGGGRRTSHNSRRGSEGDGNSHSLSSSCDSLLAGLSGDGARGGAREGHGHDGRCTQSLSNLLDPPSYQDALARLDDASIRKLRSEMCLPSAMQ